MASVRAGIATGMMMGALIVPSTVFAQPASLGLLELVAAGGGHLLWDDESSIGTGLIGGGGLGVRLTDSLRVRGRLMRSSNERDFGNGVVFEATSLRYTAELLWHPSSAAHAPYFGVGAGGFSYTRTSHYPAESRLPGQTSGRRETFTRSATDTMIGGLAGFPVVVTNRFRLGPEASLWWSRPGYFIAIEIGVAASWRF